MKKYIFSLTVFACCLQVSVAPDAYYNSYDHVFMHAAGEIAAWCSELASLYVETAAQKTHASAQQRREEMEHTSQDLQKKLSVVTRRAMMGTWPLGHQEQYKTGILARIDDIKELISEQKKPKKMGPKSLYVTAALRSFSDLANPTYWGPHTGPAAAGAAVAANIMTAKARAAQPMGRHLVLRWMTHFLRTIPLLIMFYYNGCYGSDNRLKGNSFGGIFQLMTLLQDWLALRGTKHKKLRLASLLTRLGSAALAFDMSPPSHLKQKILSLQVRIVQLQPGRLLKNECSICPDDMEKDVVCTPCKHMYHKSCLKKWLIINPTCPLCRAPVAQYGDVSSLNFYIPKKDEYRAQEETS